MGIPQLTKRAAESRAYQRLTRFKADSQRRKLDLAHAAYHSTWYIPVVREQALR